MIVPHMKRTDFDHVEQMMPELMSKVFTVLKESLIQGEGPVEIDSRDNS